MENFKKNVPLFIIVMLFLGCLPIFINWLSTKETSCELLWEPSTWASFWSTYLGAIASFAMVVVTLYVAFKNQEENQENQKLQNSLFKYQVKVQWLDKLRDATAKLYTSFYLNDLSAVADDILNKKDSANIRQSLKRLIDEKIVASFNLGVLFPKDLDAVEISLLSKINQLNDEHSALLEDLGWFVHDVAFHNGSFEMNKEMYTSKTIEYRTEKINGYNTQSKRIWEIIESYEYNIFDNHREIIKDRMQCTELFSFVNLQKAICNLIDYEENKINEIIKR